MEIQHAFKELNKKMMSSFVYILLKKIIFPKKAKTFIFMPNTNIQQKKKKKKTINKPSVILQYTKSI